MVVRGEGDRKFRAGSAADLIAMLSVRACEAI